MSKKLNRTLELAGVKPLIENKSTHLIVESKDPDDLIQAIKRSKKSYGLVTFNSDGDAYSTLEEAVYFTDKKEFDEYLVLGFQSWLIYDQQVEDFTDVTNEIKTIMDAQQHDDWEKFVDASAIYDNF